MSVHQWLGGVAHQMWSSRGIPLTQGVAGCDGSPSKKVGKPFGLTVSRLLCLFLGRFNVDNIAAKWIKSELNASLYIYICIETAKFNMKRSRIGATCHNR